MKNKNIFFMLTNNNLTTQDKIYILFGKVDNAVDIIAIPITRLYYFLTVL